ncbi:hypothetical protein DB346_15030 [Verrucomicrobia bacterium LW23]|nr:hypothetical protein DB346_15030 [Verrucomicrobia bacterium LW23]
MSQRNTRSAQDDTATATTVDGDTQAQSIIAPDPWERAKGGGIALAGWLGLGLLCSLGLLAVDAEELLRAWPNLQLEDRNLVILTYHLGGGVGGFGALMTTGALILWREGARRPAAAGFRHWWRRPANVWTAPAVPGQGDALTIRLAPLPVAAHTAAALLTLAPAGLFLLVPSVAAFRWYELDIITVGLLCMAWLFAFVQLAKAWSIARGDRDITLDFARGTLTLPSITRELPFVGDKRRVPQVFALQDVRSFAPVQPGDDTTWPGDPRMQSLLCVCLTGRPGDRPGIRQELLPLLRSNSYIFDNCGLDSTRLRHLADWLNTLLAERRASPDGIRALDPAERQRLADAEERENSVLAIDLKLTPLYQEFEREYEEIERLRAAESFHNGGDIGWDAAHGLWIRHYRTAWRQRRRLELRSRDSSLAGWLGVWRMY